MKSKFIFSAIIALFAVMIIASCSKPVDYDQKEIDAINKVLARYPDSSFKLISANGGYYNVFRYVYEEGDSTILDWEKDTIEMIYTGTSLQQNLVFAKDQTLKAPINGLIPGMKLGLHHLRRKSSCLLIIPYLSAYGIYGSGNIDPYSTLLFDVKVK